MKRLGSRIGRIGSVAAGLWLAVVALPAAGLIVQPGSGDVAPGLPTAAFGTWGGNAGAVAVAPGWVLTTRHQDVLSNPPNRTVVIDGESYTADVSRQVLLGSNIDLRLVPLTQGGSDATVDTWLSVYDGAISGAAVSITGYGPTIGTLVSDGYDWAGTQNNANGLSIGRNTVDFVATIDNPASTYDGMQVLVAHFDESGIEFEATGGPGDSGGTWLVFDDGQWQIAGLSFAVELDAEGEYDADAFFGQQFVAVDARPYASIINSIPEPTSALLLCVGGLLLVRRR